MGKEGKEGGREEEGVHEKIEINLEYTGDAERETAAAREKEEDEDEERLEEMPGRTNHVFHSPGKRHVLESSADEVRMGKRRV
eukprot:767188-Hanusia_phi.AAC.5